ncbi:hypothetical protein EOA86_00890 [Mesorhizobium sp. M5C.F.Ca.IN.020.32.2.1]|nr:hypothetical protein EOA86_00890 [Mesorhizobium sp. M5C.F.Ca.IN.020.32.2.1]
MSSLSIKSLTKRAAIDRHLSSGILSSMTDVLKAFRRISQSKADIAQAEWFCAISVSRLDGAVAPELAIKRPLAGKGAGDVESVRL